ncbi:MAG: DUF3047 domain-containing protein [Desulfobacterales bacterium]
MIRSIACLFIFLPFMISSVDSAFSEKADDKARGKDTFQKVNFMIDFTDYEEGSVESWLKGKGFEFKRDAQNRKKLDLEVGEEGLVLDVKSSMLGIILNEGVDLEEFTSIRLEWGVFDYPEGVSYEERTRNEALMVIVFFGYDKISSGSFLIPNAPYFIGFFLGREEKIGKGYIGRYFKKSGRYVCLGNPKEGETVISEYNLIEAFKRKYEKDEVPLISGIAMAIDTTKAKNQGKAKAFIKSIEFLE